MSIEPESKNALLDYVKALENRRNAERRLQVQAWLKAAGIKASLQKWPWPELTNIVVDFYPGYRGKRLLFSAHYDAVRRSPGANDNASGVAVLLGLCERLKAARVPVRIVFFDREEAWLRTPFLKLGLLGSTYYVLTHRLKNYSALYNLEFCGQGDVLCVWPVKNGERSLPAVRDLEKAAAGLKLNLITGHLPWLLLSSDHLNFRFRGLANSVTLSLVPAAHLPLLEKMVSGLSVKGLLVHKRPRLPEPLSVIHKALDDSSRLNEASLQTMLRVLLEIIANYSDED
jgi:hypothetical protein